MPDVFANITQVPPEMVDVWPATTISFAGDN